MDGIEEGMAAHGYMHTGHEMEVKGLEHGRKERSKDRHRRSSSSSSSDRIADSSRSDRRGSKAGHSSRDEKRKAYRRSGDRDGKAGQRSTSEGRGGSSRHREFWEDEWRGAYTGSTEEAWGSCGYLSEGTGDRSGRNSSSRSLGREARQGYGQDQGSGPGYPDANVGSYAKPGSRKRSSSCSSRGSGEIGWSFDPGDYWFGGEDELPFEVEDAGVGCGELAAAKKPRVKSVIVKDDTVVFGQRQQGRDAMAAAGERR
jgi:hypothetical protein